MFTWELFSFCLVAERSLNEKLKKHTESEIEKAGNSKYMKHETGMAVSLVKDLKHETRREMQDK